MEMKCRRWVEQGIAPLTASLASVFLYRSEPIRMRFLVHRAVRTVSRLLPIVLLLAVSGTSSAAFDEPTA